MKKLSCALALCTVAAMAGCSSNQTAAPTVEGSDTITGTQSVYVTGYDWGCGTSKVVLTLDYPLDAVDAGTFAVTETKQTTDFTDPTFPIVDVTVDRQVTDAYLCDAEGNKVEEASKYVALELYCSPNDGSPLLFSMITQLNTYSDPYFLDITLADGAEVTSAGTTVTSWTVDHAIETKTTDADAFEKATGEFEGVTYNYAHLKKDSDTLVVWLHGLGEGGTENTDPDITLLANKVTALGSDKFQDLVNASILVPQCPTYWMDNDGQKTNFTGGAIQADGTSYYTESLKALIDSYKDQVGATKVVLAGCSNGGYMTMVMGMAYPDAFTALVPICEAVPDKFITDDQIKDLAAQNLFFIYSEDDTTVDPTLHEVPTIERLKKAGAENLCVSTTEHVVDTTGEFKAEDGSPYQYMGHWSWIYFDNNESKDNETGVTVWDWIAEQVK